MSRRTAPFFDWNNYSSTRRHSHGTAHTPPKTSEHACHKLFEALDQARFGQVRRAVAANPVCLQGTSLPRTPASELVPLTPVDYALHNCSTWVALLEHCRRTGISFSKAGDLTLRERLTAMNLIISWLLSQPDVVPPTRNPLQVALLCNFHTVAGKLLQNDPSMARSVDGRGKTPLHVCCLISNRFSQSQSTDMIRLLMRAGADVNAMDSEGRTPLHDLVSSLAQSTPAYGLVRRRRQRHSALASSVNVVDELIFSGADLYAEDNRGITPMNEALSSGIDYLVFAERANRLHDYMCDSSFGKQSSQDYSGITGLFGLLPFDAVIHVLHNLSPRDIATGISATCVGLRRMAVSKHLWNHMKMEECLSSVREGVLRTSFESAPTV